MTKFVSWDDAMDFAAAVAFESGWPDEDEDIKARVYAAMSDPNYDPYYDGEY